MLITVRLEYFGCRADYKNKCAFIHDMFICYLPIFHLTKRSMNKSV